MIKEVEFVLMALEKEKEVLFKKNGADSFEKRMGIKFAESVICEAFGIKQTKKLASFGMIACKFCNHLYAEEITSCPKCQGVSKEIIVQSKINEV